MVWYGAVADRKNRFTRIIDVAIVPIFSFKLFVLLFFLLF